IVGSSLRLAMAVLPPAPVLLPVSAGTGWNALISMATLFSPMPRNPPTPTISPRILPFLSNSMSLTLPMRIVRAEDIGAFELGENPLVRALRGDEFRGVMRNGVGFRRRCRRWFRGQIGLR